jgi:hypothetical protein
MNLHILFIDTSIYSSSQKYVLIGLREHASTLAGLTIVEPSGGSPRQGCAFSSALALQSNAICGFEIASNLSKASTERE